MNDTPEKREPQPGQPSAGDATAKQAPPGEQIPADSNPAKQEPDTPAWAREFPIWRRCIGLGIVILMLLGYCCNEMVVQCKNAPAAPSRPAATFAPSKTFVP